MPVARGLWTVARGFGCAGFIRAPVSESLVERAAVMVKGSAMCCRIAHQFLLSGEQPAPYAPPIGAKEAGIIVEPKKNQRQDGTRVPVAQADLVKGKVGGPIGMVAEAHGSCVDGNLCVSDAVARRDSIFGAQHLGEHPCGINLRAGGDVVSPRRLGLGLRFERHAEKALV